MCATRRGSARGMVMMLVLLLVAILLIVALAVIAGSNNAAQSASAVSIKYRVLNAAEGGANKALDSLVGDPAEPSGTELNGSLNGAQWEAWIRDNNLLMTTAQPYTDPATGNTVDVPAKSAYLYGVASDQGGHTTFVEAIVSPTPPLDMPPGALNAMGTVHDDQPMAINTDPNDQSDPTDADVHSGGDILGNASLGLVQGETYAHGTENDLPGADQQAHIGANAPALPTALQVSQAVRTAGLSAQAGQTLTADQVEQGGPHTYNGNVYIDGDLTVGGANGAAPVTFQNATYVYVNGNLCIQSGGALTDQTMGKAEIVVAGDLGVQNGGQFAMAPGNNTLTIVTGADGATTSCANDYAVDFFMTASPTPGGAPPSVGTIFASNGSVVLRGKGDVTGAFDAELDLWIEGLNNQVGMQYDFHQEQTSIDTGTLGFQSYIEY